MSIKTLTRTRPYEAKIKISLRFHPLVMTALQKDSMHSSLSAKVNDILMRHYKLSI